MANDEPSLLSLIEDLISGRNDFLSGDFIRRVPFSSRAGLISRYMTNETIYLELINRINNQNFQNQSLATMLLNLSSPGVGNTTTFFNSVPIVPTRNQINSSLEEHPNTTSNCAICQDTISSGGCRIRQCGHVYHRSCVEHWFASSVRCPVCRYDIREGNQINQTSSAARQTSSQSANRSAEPSSSG